jgi:CHAT domain-containing protein
MLRADGGGFKGLPTAALLAGASCVLASAMELFDAPDAEFCERLYRNALDWENPMTFADALLKTRREMAEEYAGNPLVWAQYALWGNPWASLVKLTGRS